MQLSHLLVGLGNPGSSYALHRHNIGFMVLDAWQTMLSAPKWQKKFDGLLCQTSDITLLKPQTYMNLSGQSVQKTVQFYKLQPAQVWVVHDDLDLPFGKIRIKQGGGHGGHNGLKSIDAAIGHDYWRLRIGIGRPTPPLDAADYVLQNFSKEEQTALTNLLHQLDEGLPLLLTGQGDKLMTAVN